MTASCVALATAICPVAAQDDGRVVPPGWRVGHVRITGRPPADRPLTITRPPVGPELGDRDVFVEGGTPYNDIRAFNPAPRIDSGVQFPYGLDGIGGYGSDLGFSAGHDAANYDRGF